MKRGASLAAIAAVAFNLAACNNASDHMAANERICVVWKAPATAAPANGPANPNAAAGQNGAAPVAGDAATPVDECVKHWAYSLASSRDGAEVVAQAAVAACSSALGTWNQSAVAMSGASGADQGVSEVTGQPTNAMAEHANFAHNQALLYVVEARAGRCKPPPVVNGVPVGA